MKNQKGLKIGVFGGTFNPPHLGHVRAAELFAKECELDILYIIPASVPPHKEICGADSPAQRFLMTKTAFSDVACKKYFSATEISRAGKSYSVDTINEILSLHGEKKLYLYVGSDMLFYFEKWKNFREIFEKSVVVTAAREEKDKNELVLRCEEYREKYGLCYKILSLLHNHCR